MTERHCLITGGSSGIGAAFAVQFARQGWDLTITGRNEARLAAVAEDIRQRFSRSVTTIANDLSDPRAARHLVATIDRPVDGLVNNAGYAPPNGFADMPWIDHLASLQTMLAGPTELIHMLAPKMRERGYGRIINVSSVMAFMPASQDGGLYGPTKAYVCRMSEAMRATLYGTGVHVTALCPGLTRTEIFNRAGLDGIVAGIPDLFWQTPEQVAENGYKGCERNKPVVVSGIANKVQVAMVKMLPGAVGRYIARKATASGKAK